MDDSLPLFELLVLLFFWVGNMVIFFLLIKSAVKTGTIEAFEELNVERLLRRQVELMDPTMSPAPSPSKQVASQQERW